MNVRTGSSSRLVAWFPSPGKPLRARQRRGPGVETRDLAHAVPQPSEPRAVMIPSSRAVRVELVNVREHEPAGSGVRSAVSLDLGPQRAPRPHLWANRQMDLSEPFSQSEDCFWLHHDHASPGSGANHCVSCPVSSDACGLSGRVGGCLRNPPTQSPYPTPPPLPPPSDSG